MWHIRCNIDVWLHFKHIPFTFRTPNSFCSKILEKNLNAFVILCLLNLNTLKHFRTDRYVLKICVAHRAFRVLYKNNVSYKICVVIRKPVLHCLVRLRDIQKQSRHFVCKLPSNNAWQHSRTHRQKNTKLGVRFFWLMSNDHLVQ